MKIEIYPPRSHSMAERKRLRRYQPAAAVWLTRYRDLDTVLLGGDGDALVREVGYGAGVIADGGNGGRKLQIQLSGLAVR